MVVVARWAGRELAFAGVELRALAEGVVGQQPLERGLQHA